MRRIVLAGNAVTAEILYSYLANDARYSVAGFTVDDDYVDKGSSFPLATVGLSELSGRFAPGEHRIVMAMGYSGVNAHRRSMFERLKGMGYAIETYIHPSAMIHTSHPIGEGSVVLPGVLVEPEVRVGIDTILWGNVTLAHHATVGDHAWIASGAVVSGKARIGDQCFIGVNATIVNAVTLGDNVIVGGGALITKDVKPSTVHLARSAEQIRFNAQDYAKHFGV
ncbi:Sugar O-acyltransferase, sialic acid O-acetyltransferase NeuD family [Bosea sp. 62]|uniref:acetyltransferase n=1 Tax=unclassified Bosea (in: a-proteobacteria) TaxID=2653178 RepID=UPI00125578E6|nr:MULTISPECIES: acetyltransferase [unclassified Bosea (in: a-proteobacteria)]CAD5285499.1 Sugar O-acyltransferase, sialic acid O-acetyltransferase NeuD family [Bosea sp. 21B]CAD5288172.1 Sugar O-acyltransferase, sialic acid O-acetyltransferase NeuD family [Bosea sp. 46]CAD5301476.1 Sugar O-acyltransferase, sialic acid O-acetyltransferase NeuD family [Bosea sp. 7B]VVT51084.1 Sugar O-acyltransferase, sialic acid O-acetyltransferase NeuD family [Bosea sp. EC-HK365B]VXB08808.1 Sugar O-acyltransfe